VRHGFAAKQLGDLRGVQGRLFARLVAIGRLDAARRIVGPHPERVVFARRHFRESPP
jgi:hypothetical protein